MVARLVPGEVREAVVPMLVAERLGVVARLLLGLPQVAVVATFG